MKQIKTIYYVLAALLLLVSCKAEEDVWTATLYRDASIKTFTLGTLNRYIHGEKVTYDASGYTMQINALTHEVMNVDSLPLYTDPAHVICVATTVNNGALYIKSRTDDTFTVYSSSDSIDFSEPRLFRVVASDATCFNDFTVKLNVHKEDGDLMVWKKQSTKPIMPTPAGVAKYLGKSTYEEYGLAADGKLMQRATEGGSWQQAIGDLHEDIGQFPTQDIALTSYPMTMADSVDYVLLAGNDGTKTKVWRKVVDYTAKQPKGSWSYMDRRSETIGLLPLLKSLSLIYYDGVVMAFGGDYGMVYESRDNGITWQMSTRIVMPDDFDFENTAAMVVTTDSDNFIWLVCTMKDGTEKIWKGRFNKFGWQR